MSKDSVELSKLNEAETKVYNTYLTKLNGNTLDSEEKGKLDVIEYHDCCVISKAKIAVTSCGIFLLIGVFALFVRMSVTE